MAVLSVAVENEIMKRGYPHENAFVRQPHT
jgi:hypothetical protein